MHRGRSLGLHTHVMGYRGMHACTNLQIKYVLHTLLAQTRSASPNFPVPENL